MSIGSLDLAPDWPGKEMFNELAAVVRSPLGHVFGSGRCGFVPRLPMVTALLLAFALCLLLSLPAAADEPASGFLVPVENLTNQETRPFSLAERELTPESARWKHYRKAIRAFPNATDCLVAEERQKSVVNLLLMDWESVRAYKFNGFEVCMFRILTSLENAEQIEEWMAYHDFKVIPLRRTRGDQPKSTKPWEFYTTHQIEGKWSVEQTQERYPTFFYQFFGVTTAKAIVLVVRLTNEYKVAGVHLYPVTK